MEHFRTVTVTEENKYKQTISNGVHAWVADEPVDQGGNDLGPNPFDHLFAALGACTSMTLRMYADRKKWPLEGVSVSLNGRRDPDAFVITREITVKGPLSDEQKQMLLVIADKCPVHKVLVGSIKTESKVL